MSTERAGAARPGDRNLAVYERLRGAIINGDLQPNERLIESDLTQATGGTRSSIRLALVRLEQEGLVSREPNRGARVRMVSDREAVEITEARAALELLAVRHAAVNATDRDLLQLRAILSQMRDSTEGGDLLAYTELNGQFHRAIMAASHHDTAVRLLSMLRSQIVRFQYQTILQPGRARQSLMEHEAIAAAIERRDPQKAEAVMREHLIHVVETLRAAVAAHRSRKQWPR